MMNILEEAIIYATVMHQGKVRKIKETPFILHPMEVAQILATMTDDLEIISAGILHDIVEGTDGTLEEIEKRFGKRVASIVASNSETDFPGEERSATWKRRKEASLQQLKNASEIGVRMLWLADELANMRSLTGNYAEQGEALWQKLDQTNPDIQRWYYQSVAEMLELTLNKTGAFKELIQRINFIWPGTFDSEKARYKKYREVSVDGCRLIGRGAKGDVYRYNDEMVIKVFNQNNTYHDVEREIALSRKAFILGMPTAISFGIVSVGNRYGAMYELVDSETISSFIARAPSQVDLYAKSMAELARLVHSVTSVEEDGFPDGKDRLREYIDGGIACEDEALAGKCIQLINELPAVNTMIHGDFHTGNVFLHYGEPLLIDMDRVARAHPIAELSDLYYFYVVLGENDPSGVEKFMGFSCDTCRRFFHSFLRHYLETDNENRITEVSEKASLISYSRMIRKLHKYGTPSEENRVLIDRYVKKIAALTEKLDTLTF